jgi:hypothetical protein
MIEVGSTTGPKAKQLFNSQAAEFGGWKESWTSASGRFDVPVEHGKLAVRLPKRSVVVFQFGK